MPRNVPTSRVTVKPKGNASYNVLVGQGLLARSSALARAAGLRPKRVLVAFDRSLPTRIIDQVIASWESARVATTALAMVADEQQKSIEALAGLWQACSDAQLDRNDAIIALGGGLIGDVVGFAASTYRRGIAWVQCPTTLLACVDASVGGKTAINLPQEGSQGDGRTLIKNLVGSFHQPSLVLSDVNALASLPRSVVSDGLAECIKHACLCDHATQAKGNNQLARTMKLVAPVLAGSPAARAKLIASNVAIKAAIAGPDVTERAPDKTGGRALLNFGHTFAHVLEGLSAHNGGGGGQRERSRKVHVGSKRASTSHVSHVSHVAHVSHVSHGQAVALGMVAAAHAGLVLKTCTPGLVAMLLDAIDAAELPTHVPSHVLLPPADELIRRMVATDKKVLAGMLRIIVPVGSVPGRCKVVASPNEAALRAGWESLRAVSDQA